MKRESYFTIYLSILAIALAGVLLFCSFKLVMMNRNHRKLPDATTTATPIIETTINNFNPQTEQWFRKQLDAISWYNRELNRLMNSYNTQAISHHHVALCSVCKERVKSIKSYSAALYQAIAKYNIYASINGKEFMEAKQLPLIIITDVQTNKLRKETN